MLKMIWQWLHRLFYIIKAVWTGHINVEVRLMIATSTIAGHSSRVVPQLMRRLKRKETSKYNSLRGMLHARCSAVQCSACIS